MRQGLFCKPISPWKDLKMKWLKQDFVHSLKMARLRKFAVTPQCPCWLWISSSLLLCFLVAFVLWTLNYPVPLPLPHMVFFCIFQVRCARAHAHTHTHATHTLPESLFIKLMFLGFGVREVSWAQTKCWIVREPTRAPPRECSQQTLFFSLFSAHGENPLRPCCRSPEICLRKSKSVSGFQEPVRAENIFLVNTDLTRMWGARVRIAGNFQKAVLRRHLSSENGSVGAKHTPRRTRAPSSGQRAWPLEVERSASWENRCLRNRDA